MASLKVTIPGVFRFLSQETARMEEVLAEFSGDMPPKSVLETLVDGFSQSAERKGSGLSPNYKQVWNWFMNRRHALRRDIKKSSPAGFAEQSQVQHQQFQLQPQQQQQLSNQVSHLEYEAKSSRDGAWYDVDTFSGQRINDAGEPEVLVNFAGFGDEENEWVHAGKNVRLRSLPCENTDCLAIWPADLVLCFQEANDQALYFDADVLDIQRRRHDWRGCRCRFWVRYCHDEIEEVVPLRKLCRRPETDNRLKLAGIPLPDGADPTNRVVVGEGMS